MVELASHQLDQSFGLVILLVLPIVFWYYSRLNTSTFLLSLIITLAFLEGSLELLGILPSNYNSLLRDLILALALLDLVLRNPRVTIYKWVPLLVLLFSVVMSFVLNDGSFSQLVYFLRKVLPNLLLLYYVANLMIVNESIERLKKYVKLLFVVQILISIIKFYLYGMYENYIGSISNIAGSISANFALVAIAYLWSVYLVKPKKDLVILIFGFIFFAISGGKRSIVVFIPIILTLGYFFNGRLGLRQLLMISLIGTTLLSVFVYLNFGSRLKQSGLSLTSSFKLASNIELLMSYYQSRAMAEKNSKLGVSNNRVLAYGFYLSKYGGDIQDLLFGAHGPGSLYPANATDQRKYGAGEQYMFNKYKIGYGMRIGFLWNTFQAGLIFTVVYFLLLYRFTFNRVLIQKLNIQEGLFIRLLFVVFVLDSLIYSSTFFIPSVITVVFYVVLGLFINKSYLSAQPEGYIKI